MITVWMALISWLSLLLNLLNKICRNKKKIIMKSSRYTMYISTTSNTQLHDRARQNSSQLKFQKGIISSISVVLYIYNTSYFIIYYVHRKSVFTKHSFVMLHVRPTSFLQCNFPHKCIWKPNIASAENWFAHALIFGTPWITSIMLIFGKFCKFYGVVRTTWVMTCLYVSENFCGVNSNFIRFLISHCNF